MNKITLLAVLALGAAPLAFTGCKTTDSAVSSVRGEIKSMINGTLPDVYRATQKAIEDVKFTKQKEAVAAFTGVLICRTADDRRVDIRLTVEGDKIIGVAIRVGAFGDEKIANALIERIKAHL